MALETPRNFRSIFNPKRYYAYVCNGSKGSGKSTWLEYAAEKFLLMGFLVFDFWAAPYENLYWCIGGKRDPNRRSDGRARNLGYPVLIIHPATVELEPLCICGRDRKIHESHMESLEGKCTGYVDSSRCTCGKARHEHADPNWRCKRFVPLILTVTDETSLAEIVKMVLEEGRIQKRVIIFNEAFYDDLRDAYKVLVRYLKEYPVLIKRGIIPNEVGCCAVFREVADLVTGGVKVIAGNYATETRRSMQVMIRKCRHMHTQLLLDSQRNDDIAAAVSENRDYLILKQSTEDLIPQKYEWVINEIEYQQESATDDIDFDRAEKWIPITMLEKWQYYVIFPDNSVELRFSSQPGFMHKGEHDDWFQLTGITPRYSEKRQSAKSAAGRAQEILNNAESKDRRRNILQKAYNVSIREKKPWPRIAVEDVPEWSEFGKPGSLWRAVKRALRDGDVVQV